jgi:hypothetical protein
MKFSMKGQENVTFKYRWLLKTWDCMGRVFKKCLYLVTLIIFDRWWGRPRIIAGKFGKVVSEQIFIWFSVKLGLLAYLEDPCAVNSAHAVPCFKQSPVFKGYIKQICNFADTVKPVLRGHIWSKEKVAL